MKHAYPKPEDVGVKIPFYLNKEGFRRGFYHSLQGSQLTLCEHLKLSFKEGYRAGKLFLRDVGKRNNIIAFPLKEHVQIYADDLGIA